MITPRSQLNESGNAIPSLSDHHIQGDNQDGDNNNNVHLLIEHSYSCLSSLEHATSPSNGSTIANGNGQVTHLSEKETTVDAVASSDPEPRVTPTVEADVSKEASIEPVSESTCTSAPSTVNTNGSTGKVNNSTLVEAPSVETSLRTRSGRERKVPAKLLDRDFIDTSEMLLSSNRKNSGDSNSIVPLAPPKSGNTRETRRNSKGSKVTEAVKDEKESENDDESEDEENEDDDPYKEYCICRKPHGNKFMICCDNCQDWFHGKCIGVSKKQSENFEVWICSTCKENNPSLQCKVKAASVSTGMSDGRKRLSSESSDGNKINDRVERTGPHTKGSDVRIKKPSKVQVANGLSNKSKDKSGDINSDEEKDKVRLKELIDKRKRELAEKEKKREKKLAQLDPTMNQLFQMDSDTSGHGKKM